MALGLLLRERAGRGGGGAVTLAVEFVCTSCGETLDVEQKDGEFIEHGEFHECWGETWYLVAVVTDISIRVTRDEIEVRVT